MAMIDPEELFATLARYGPTRAALLRLWASTPTPVRAVLLNHMPVARFRVGVLGLLVREDGRVLLLEHRFRAHHPWGLPGGWLGGTEDPAEGLARELAEELDLQVPAVDLRLLEAITPYDSPRLELFFAVPATPRSVPPNIEFLSSRWFDASELPTDMFPPHRALVLRHLGAQDRDSEEA